jgi:hypothetical protein
MYIEEQVAMHIPNARIKSGNEGVVENEEKSTKSSSCPNSWSNHTGVNAFGDHDWFLLGWICRASRLYQLN